MDERVHLGASAAVASRTAASSGPNVTVSIAEADTTISTAFRDMVNVLQLLSFMLAIIRGSEILRCVRNS